MDGEERQWERDKWEPEGIGPCIVNDPLETGVNGIPPQKGKA